MVINKEKLLNIAQKYILKGQSKKAIQEYLKLIEASPKDKRLYLKLGDLYLKNGENDKAIKEYLKLAELYEEEDLNFRAISIYKRVLSIDPKFTEASHKIARLYLKEGLTGSAKSYYQSILEIKPDDQEALKGLEEIDGPQINKESPKITASAISTIPKTHLISEQERIQNKPTSVLPPHTPSMVTYETETASPDKDSEMHYHLGIAYKEMELFDYAIPEFELASTNPLLKFDCYIMLGNCLMEKGDFDKSIEYFKIASEIPGLTNEKLARLNFYLGIAYEAKGMIAEALDTFALVLRLDQSFSEAQERINRLQGK